MGCLNSVLIKEGSPPFPYTGLRGKGDSPHLFWIFDKESEGRVMEREIMPDYEAEAFYRRLIPTEVFEGVEGAQKEPNHCVVFCKKVAPNVFDIKKGVAVVNGAKDLFNDGICMIAPATKVVFVFE